MKQRGVGEHAIKMVIRQIELEEILLPHFAAAVDARHYGEQRGTFQADREVAEFDEHLEVAARPTTKIQYRERRFTLDGSQERLDVLTDVMIARAFPELLGIPVVIFEREIRAFSQGFRIQFHVRSKHTHSTVKTERFSQ